MEKINGEWSEAKNMGGNINSAWDEDAPFMGLDNNVLYFSSTDSTSMGEFDIFMAVRDENNIWSNPVNLGYPINSVGDDLFTRIQQMVKKHILRHLGRVEKAKKTSTELI